MVIQVTKLDPTLAEIIIAWPLSPGQSARDYELRGRVVGPHCPAAETIEVSYPARATSREANVLRARVVIPDPSFWTPETPFLYTAYIELHKAGQPVERMEKTLGLALKNERGNACSAALA